MSDNTTPNDTIFSKVIENLKTDFKWQVERIPENCNELIHEIIASTLKAIQNEYKKNS